MNRMKERDNSNKAQWRLALAYAIAGHNNEAEKLVTTLTTAVAEYRELSNTYGSQQRDQAMILETLVRLGKKEKAFELLTSVAKNLGNANHWMSTQTTAYSLIAIAKYAKENAIGKKLNVEIVVNNRNVTFSNDSFVSQVFLQSPQASQSISVKNNGESPVYVRLIRRGVPLIGNEKEVSRNIQLSVRYTNKNGEEISVDELKQGTDFMASVTVHNTGMGVDYKELALSQLFPSGWEIINTRLEGTQQYYNQGSPDYQDIRDDRVYTYFDLKANERKVFTVQLNSSYQGKFYLPSLAVEAMYDNNIFANKAGKWVKVVRE